MPDQPFAPRSNFAEPPSGSSDLANIAAQLRTEIPELTERAWETIRAELNDYHRVNRKEIIRSLTKLFTLTIDTLATGSLPSSSEIILANYVTNARSNQGVPIEAILRAFHLILTTARKRLIEVARNQSLPLETIITGSNLMWDLDSALTHSAAHEYRRSTVARLAERRVAKTELIQAVTRHPAGHSTILDAADKLGLAHDSQYKALITCGDLQSNWDDTVEHNCSLPGAPAIATTTHSAGIALVPADCPRVDLGHTVAVGPTTSLSNAPQSWAVALDLSKSLAASDGCWHDIESVSWKIAVPREPIVAEMLRDKYLTPLKENHDYGLALIESCWAVIRHRHNIKKAAAELYIHENTLRHRLSRFERLTQVNISLANTHIELEWLRHALNLGQISGIDAPFHKA